MKEGGGIVLDCESSFNNNSLFQFSSNIGVGATPNLSQVNTSSLDNEELPGFDATELHVLFNYRRIQLLSISPAFRLPAIIQIPHW
jgi:hypothetical protein